MYVSNNLYVIMVWRISNKIVWGTILLLSHSNDSYKMVITSFPTTQVTEYSFFIHTQIVLDLYGFEPANPPFPPPQHKGIILGFHP